MHIDTNLDRELNDDHPIIGELTTNEAAIFWSAVDTVVEAADIAAEHHDHNGDVDLDSPKLLEANILFEESITLLELLREVALWRSTEDLPPKIKKHVNRSSDPDFESNNGVEEIL